MRDTGQIPCQNITGRAERGPFRISHLVRNGDDVEQLAVPIVNHGERRVHPTSETASTERNGRNTGIEFEA